jgi:hypothetical protein
MIPITSYQSARPVSYVAATLNLSPACNLTRQPAGVAPIETSHDTAPAGS